MRKRLERNVSVSWPASSVRLPISGLAGRVLQAHADRPGRAGSAAAPRVGSRLRLLLASSSSRRRPAAGVGGGLRRRRRVGLVAGAVVVAAPRAEQVERRRRAARTPTITAIHGANTGRRGRERRLPRFVPNGVSSWPDGPLVARAVLLDQLARVEPEVVRVGAQERLDERGPGQQVPLLVLERAQVLGPDLRRRFHLGDVDPVAHARLAQLVPDLRHAAPRLGHCPRRPGPATASPRSSIAASTRGTSASEMSTWRGFEPS